MIVKKQYPEWGLDVRLPHILYWHGNLLHEGTNWFYQNIC